MASELQGYGIVEADSLTTAVSLANEHPLLTARDGRHCIDVIELVDLEV
ncbi:hypothetical protein [Cryobacterium sp. PH31-L1]|nr:hypothetical protein [Cryobacterium sp. PH31-L1]MDJ0379035.1 hypothetical protein [Cryobacterium sp. PH31-L1]